jgi:hypothetical protein
MNGRVLCTCPLLPFRKGLDFENSVTASHSSCMTWSAGTLSVAISHALFYMVLKRMGYKVPEPASWVQQALLGQQQVTALGG